MILFFNVFNTHVDYGLNVVVVQGIDDRLALLAVFDQPCIFQNSQLMGNCRHTHAEFFGDVANAHLALKKQIENFDACAVAHDREKFREIEKMLVIGEIYLIYYFVMGLMLATDGRYFMIMLHYMPPWFDS